MSDLSEEQTKTISAMRERGYDQPAMKLEGLFAQINERPHDPQLIEMIAVMVKQYMEGQPAVEKIPPKAEPPRCDECPVRMPQETAADFGIRVLIHRGLPIPEEGRKHDGGKRLWRLLPKVPVEKVIEVLEFGVEKYARDNWQKVPDGRERYYDAAMRHLSHWNDGEELDPDSGLPHLAHAGCCILFMLWDGEFPPPESST